MNNSKNTNIYIIEIEARHLTNIYEIKENERDSKYSSSLPLSLDILKLKKKFPEEFFTKNEKTKKIKIYKDELFNKIGNDKLYTDAIINISFTKALHERLDNPKIVHEIGKYDLKKQAIYKGKIKMNTRILRRKLYKEGVILKLGESLVEYVKYKRSSSKAREGSHLFIKKELKDAMNDWYEFGVKFEYGDKNVLLAAIKAYESLTSSGIEKTIKIQPSEILLIGDFVNEVKIKASVTIEGNTGKIKAVDDDDCTIENTIWDGQSLADTSLFDDEESKEQKGMMLLRNSFFKSCVFNTNIQKWFDDAFGDNKPDFVKDMFGRNVQRTNIKLITTPSSLKFLKFADKFKVVGDNKTEREQKCYEKWLASISCEFGVCKSESSSPFGEYRPLSYQIVNSLPLSKDEIHELLQDDLKHIEKMKNDVTYFKSFIKNRTKDPMPADALMLKLLEINDKMWYTQMVKDYVKDMVDDYIANLRKGRIKVNISDYAVLFGNPLEMLQYAAFGEIRNRPLTGKCIYCSNYKNGEILVGFRNPHITMGNVLVAENVYKEEFDKYFNLSKNIVISNAYDTDIMERLQGQDYDSDMVLLSSNPVLVKSAEACQSDKFRVPINKIKGENTGRKYTISDEVDIDYKTAKNKIGEIVNLSQILNSYYWDFDYKNDDGLYDGILKEIYSYISILSSLSQIEIDRAKKDYETDSKEFINELGKKLYNGELLLKRTLKSIPKTTLSDEEYQNSEILEGDIYDAGFYREKYQNDEEAIIQLRQEQEGLLNSKGKSDKEMEIINGRIAELEYELENIDLYLGYEKIIEEIESEINDIFSSTEKSVQIRPEFFKYCNKRGQSKRERYVYKTFNTPMDYLQKEIDKIPAKKRTKTVDITKIIPKPNFRKADNYQLPKIIEVCTETSGDIVFLQSNQNIPDEIKFLRIRESYDKAIQELKKWKINDNTIRVVLYKAFSKKSEKYYDKKYSEIKRVLASCLYQSHPEAFMQVIEMSKGNTQSK